MTAYHPTLSFVIPTLNFASFLPATLDSIIDEGYGPLEIVVFDGGSTDDTLAVLEAYRAAKFPDLKVIVATERGNIDIDLNKGVAAATGEYIWTMSSDDALIPGWSKIIADRLQRFSPDLMLIPAVHCDIYLRLRRNYPILCDTVAGELIAKLTVDSDVITYLDNVRTSEGLFSFCSACLVRRERLVRAPQLEDANGTYWRYSARLIAILTDYPSQILVLNIPLLLKRGENDSFASVGIIRRLAIATTSWDRAISLLPLGERVSRAMLRRVKSDIRPISISYLSQFIRDEEEQAIYDECVRSRLGEGSYSNRLLARVLPHVPHFKILKRALLVARPMFRSIQRRFWQSRLRAVTAMPDKAELTACKKLNDL